MKAIILAAGVGRRLYGDENDDLPKALLSFEGSTLFHRHVEILLDLGVGELVLVVGHRADDLLAEAERVAPAGFVRALFNPRFKEGPVLSLATAADELRAGEPVLFMDADVLYHPEMLARLVRSKHENCFIIDHELEPGEEPVKLCLKDGVTVDFGKQVTDDFDEIGEWPGFMKMSAAIAAKVADAAQAYVDADTVDTTYEEAFRDVLRAEPPGTFGVEDITDVPWIEIDFPSDLIRAREIIYPRVEDFDAADRAADQAGLRDKASGE